MHYISDILFWISTGLLVPVIVLLIYFFIRALILAGSFFGQYIDRQRVMKRVQPDIDALTVAEVEQLADKLPNKSRSLFVFYLRQMLAAGDNIPKVDKIMAEYESAADKDLSISKMLTKMGPMLGLMGTLIPMGPALVGLSTGDIASMAYNMQVAFATTVVGLFSSAVGFATQQAKQRWYLSELNDLEYVANLIKAKNA
ncbi:MAG: MotA/TolQ/ExbB proton channel family protein [Bacteroidales bacterium]|nr:MotA/TolQ/ExbB proton channel family protein [Bacteroidales bacterium]